MAPAVVTLGETMALLSGSPGRPLAFESHVRLSTGGAESNVAIGLQRLGVPAAWIGRVGADPFGDRVVRDLQGEGVHTIAIRDGGAPTGLMLKEQRGDTTHVWYARAGSAGSRLAPQDIPPDLVASARLVHLTGITPALSATAADAVGHAIDLARSAGARVSFDVNFRSKLWTGEAARDALAPLLDRVDILFAGPDEARLFCPGVADDELPAALAGMGPDEVVLKRGDRGALALAGGQLLDQPAVAVAVVDTVGAGDAFVAGYLAEWLAGAEPSARLHTAARVGAIACTARGDWESLPTRAELDTEPSRDRVVR